MRSNKLTAAVAASACLLALAPAGAAAAGNSTSDSHAHASKASGCRVVVQAEPHTITNGEPVQVFGQLLCTPISMGENQSVTVYQRSVGSPSYTVDETVMTGSGGFYALKAQSGLTADTSFYARALTVRSPKATVKVAPQVTLSGPNEKLPLLTGFRNRSTFTGTVSPNDGGAEVLLERENSSSSEEWHQIQKTTVTGQGGFTFIHAFAIPGDANLRAVVRPHGKFTVRGISNQPSYTITQAENPNLTLVANEDPIAFSKSVTLTGTVKNGGGKTVTLLGHTAGKSFETITSIVANAKGEYEFTEKPEHSTYYQATSGTLKSAVLFEGVRYAVTLTTTPPIKLQSGQALSLTGTVQPGAHFVYLERQNQFGGGFHVVDVGAVDNKGNYTINHFVFGFGKAVFRVKAPGNPENQAGSTAAFTVEVTPAPPAALHPVGPSNLPL